VARAAGESERTIATLPAGRGEVFAQLVKVDARGDVHPLDDPSHLTPRRLLEKVRAMRPLRWAGEGASIHEEAIREQARSEGIPFSRDDESGAVEGDAARGWTLARPPSVLAAEVAALAVMRARSGQVSPPDQLRAVYVRPSDAELNERCRE
jgi:tRNA A37 threonylcarbamoyladenosine modification protein TsaB